MRQVFQAEHLRALEQERRRAERLVWRFYALSERESERIHYEVKTLRDLRPEEVSHEALAHVMCYEFVRRVGSYVLQQYELYRICLQDHRLLEVARALPRPLDLSALLLYVLTHELVHVVRFVQKLQRIDLPMDERAAEEAFVERTTWTILAGVRAYPMERLREFLSLSEWSGLGEERPVRTDAFARPPHRGGLSDVASGTAIASAWYALDLNRLAF
ncbi:MAG: hypothetical protein N0A16_04845 [Blastocatellia bacterium]|nr:hypothetical protein [Blastocatellia bacterium]MCS7157040.1 hypothetical protein [Blastocatellia bacterium]MCX7752241.1 hypothetical protein [Blastocatellia bacterium]MDW8167732.1 hypothetical protein [Acidobacteriota bacterium]MDW8256332.1 hypothetical protein [Acidobacteriota bacterium]